MSEEKKLILKMLKEGKITEDEAITLLDSIKETKKKSDFSSLENSFIEKITQAAAKITKKSQEVLSNLDFEDISINFSSSSDQKTKTERVVSENIIGIENPILDVENENGKISLYSWDNEEIEAKADVNYDDRYISSTYDFIKLIREDNKIIIRPNYDNASARHFNIGFKIAVPKKLFEKISLNSTNASIELREILANQLVVKSTNAKISVKDIEAKDAEFSSTNAKISVEGIKGNDLYIHTTNGKIELDNINSTLIKMETTNGTLNVQNIKENVEKISANTNNGNINISLKEVFKPVKAKVKNHFKDINITNFSDSMFTNFVNESGAMIAFSDGYDEEKENLNIDAATYNGTINIK